MIAISFRFYIKLNNIIGLFLELCNRKHENNDTPNAQVQVQQISSTKKEYVTRLQVDRLKRNLFSGNDEEYTNCEVFAEKSLTSDASVSSGADDSDKEYLPETEDESEQDSSSEDLAELIEKQPITNVSK